MLPTLLVHGIWDDGARFDRLRAALERAGAPRVEALDLWPNDGSAPIERLAAQVQARADAMGVERIDLVGFSMGALVGRWWLQRMGGRDRVRRFVSISGPHHGTATAWALSRAGVRQMRPGSPLLADLASDEDPWGEVEVHSIWTPWDLMIVPPRSSRLRGARGEHRIGVPLHRWMIRHPEAVSTVVRVLRGA
ncbi:MAG TPA: alpha/beta fold hydrolase [Sandaracinaceae bacterium LLY-WYZ-13_1]|nr:alpha/beta fold hydrolase [Sandaracinaceae bacterium LLY-WYZ-13_1]